MTGELVLVTGASGHIGFRVVINALEAGYHVRAAVRNQVKADTILTAPSIKALAPGKKLTFVFIPDMLADGAFDEAVKDVTYIIHIASPLPTPSEDYDRDLIQPAVNGTTGILKSALMTPSVKRIVITSSMAAVIPWKCLSSEESDQVFTADDRIADTQPPFAHPAEAYCASKVRALNATDKFMETEKPHFEVSNVMPSVCVGKNELTQTIIMSHNLELSVATPPTFAAKPTQPSATTNTPGNTPKRAELRLETHLLRGLFFSSGGGVAGSAGGGLPLEERPGGRIAALKMASAVASGLSRMYYSLGITDAKYILGGSNNTAFAPVLGRKSDFPMLGAMCHVDDVAKVHVLALGRKVEGNQNFGLVSDGVAGNKWSDSIRFAKKHFPQAVKDWRLPADGAQPTHRLLIDASKTDETLRIKQRSYEEAVTSVVEHYLELLEKAGGKVEDVPSLGV